MVPDPLRARPRLLTALIVLLTLSTVLGTTAFLLNPAQLLDPYPRLRPWFVPYLGMSAVILVALAGLWQWRRWGLTLFVVVSVAVFAFEVATMGFAPHVWRVPVAALLLGAAVWPHRSRFS